jgi:uncharacterized protein YndB with AHSA1/START domain
MFKWLFGKKDEAVGAVGGTAEIIVINRRVKATPERAFALFVDEIGRWWPRDLTWAKDSLDAVGIEAKVGGRAFERDKAGAESPWGTVLSMRRPEHIVLAWQIKADRTPEASEATSSRVDVRFVAVDADTTDVVVVHRDFPRHGDGWQAYKAQMAGKDGWPRLMDAFAKSAAG